MPECATCGGYISSDFARVFGDNDRIVHSCPACHGAAPEPAESVEPKPSAAASTESTRTTSSPSVATSTTADTSSTDASSTSSARPTTAVAATPGGASESVADATETETPSTGRVIIRDDGTLVKTDVPESQAEDAAEPEPASTGATNGQSALGYIRSVFFG